MISSIVRPIYPATSMSTKNLILLSLILLLWGCKKTEISQTNPQPQAPLGEKLYNPGDSTGESLIFEISKTPDNNIIVTGEKALYNNSIGYMSYYPMRITLDRNSLSVVSSGSPLLNKYGIGIQSRQSNNFIYTLIILTDPMGQPINKIEVLKTDTSKNIIWEKTYDSVTNATSLELLSDGDLLVEGNYGSDATASSNTMVLLKLDPNGNIVFKHQYTGQFYGGSFDVLEENNDYALMTFNSAYSYVYSFILMPSLLKIDFAGNVISSAPFNTFFLGQSWHYFTSYHLTKKMQGGYILASTFVDTAGGAVDEYFFMNLLNSDGTVTKSANLWITGTPVFRIADVLQTQNGNIFALVCLNSSGNYTTEVLEYDSQGNFLNAAGISIDRYPVGLVEAENNNIIVVQNYGATTISVLKLDQSLRIL
jgi:hypothetical protein